MPGSETYASELPSGAKLGNEPSRRSKSRPGAHARIPHTMCHTSHLPHLLGLCKT